MQYQVGYCRKVTNPDAPVPLTGYSTEPVRFHTAITEDICITCVAFSDGETTVLAIGTDLCTLRDNIAPKLRETVSQATGIPQERIYIAATHTHSGPALQCDEYESVRQYQEKFFQNLQDAAKEARYRL